MREWKRAFEIDPEATATEKPRVEVTTRRKSWLARAWTYFFGYIPNAIPIYNEREGFAHRPGKNINWHHIETIGEATRIHGEDEHYYNNPRNLVPVDVVNHVGTGATEDDFVIHEDTQRAKGLYGLFKQGKIENPYKTMGDERRKLTSAGLIYHNPDYDEYLRDLADQVVSTYQRDHPDDVY